MGSAIHVDNVSKRFRLYKEKPESLKERIIRLGRNPSEEFWALQDISLDVVEGETIGLIGQNGSGKSTLLKCISGILRPTSGRITKSGRTAALLELGSGFHPDLTGRENIFLNSSIIGLTKRDTLRIFDDIVSFAELEEFIDLPVKHYSSGMYARLAFAVAVNVEPQLLLIDEVLAVGDEAFQRKCMQRIREFQTEGRTILLVTHGVETVRQICDRAAVLDHGKLISLGEPAEAVLVFRDSLLKREHAGAEEADSKTEQGSTGDEWRKHQQIRITGGSVEYAQLERRFLRAGEPLRVVLQYDAPRRVDDVVFAINIHDQNGNLLFGANTDTINADPGSVEGKGQVVFEFEEVPLLGGIYEISLGVHTHDGGVEYDHRAGEDVIEVLGSGKVAGIVHLPIHVKFDLD